MGYIKKDMIFIFIGLVLITLLLYGFKNKVFEGFDVTAEDVSLQYNPILLNLFYIGFSQFYSDDSNTYNINHTFSALKKDVYVAPTDLYIACDFTENINKADMLTCDQINMFNISTTFIQTRDAVTLKGHNCNQQYVTILNQDYFFACKTINFNDCVLDTTVLPVQNLINITMNKINTYNSLSTQTQYILTFKNTVMNKFVFCRPMIIYIPPWGLFRVIYQSKALNNDTSLQNNCMCFYNSNSKLNTILVEFIQPVTHNYKSQNPIDNFSISPVPTTSITVPTAINEQNDVALFYLDFDFLPSVYTSSSTLTTCGSFLLHLSSKNYANPISKAAKTINFKLCDFTDSTILSYLNIYLNLNDNPALCINSQCISGNNTGNYFPTKTEFDMTRIFDKYDIFLSFCKKHITIVIFTLTGTVNNHFSKRIETNLTVQTDNTTMDNEYIALSSQFELRPLHGTKNFMSYYCIPNFERIGSSLGYNI